jgi:hypothetical protein
MACLSGSDKTAVSVCALVADLHRVRPRQLHVLRRRAVPVPRPATRAAFGSSCGPALREGGTVGRLLPRLPRDSHSAAELPLRLATPVSASTPLFDLVQPADAAAAATAATAAAAAAAAAAAYRRSHTQGVERGCRRCSHRTDRVVEADPQQQRGVALED